MPTLKQVTCHVEWASTNIPFEEYGIVYGDGIVESYIAVPHKPQPFTIHLTSSGYIAEGLAMIVYIDGQYQCNRNRVNLKPSKPGQQRNRVDVDFRVRQKEQTIGDGTFIGKDWRFDVHTIVPMGVVPTNFDSSHFEKLGEIEILILRCRAKRDIEIDSASSDSGTHVSFDPTGEKSKDDLVTAGKKKKGRKHQAFVSNGDGGGAMHVQASFDGANERPHQLGLDGEAPPGGHWSWSYIPAYQSPDSIPSSRPQKHVHFDYGSAPQQYQPRDSAPPESYRPPSGYRVDSENVAQELPRKPGWGDSGQNRSTPSSANQYWNTPAGAIPYPPVPPPAPPPVPPSYPWQTPSQIASVPTAWAPPSTIPSAIPSWPSQVPQFVNVPTYPSVPFAAPPFYAPNPYQVQFSSYVTPFPIPAAGAGAVRDEKAAKVSQATVPAKDDSNNDTNNVSGWETGNYNVSGWEMGNNNVSGWETGNNNVSGWETGNNDSSNSSNTNNGNSGNNDWTPGNDKDNNNPVNDQHSQTNTWNCAPDNSQNGQNKQTNVSGFETAASSGPVQSLGNWDQPNNPVQQQKQPKVPRAQAGQLPQDNTALEQHRGIDGYESQYVSMGNPRRLYGPHGPYYSMQSGARNDTSLAIEQEMPPYDVPAFVAAQLGTTQQVQHGKGYHYLHKRTSPVYLDDIANPYARFVFKYRTKEQVEQQTGIPIEAEPSGNEEVRNLQAFGQDELIKMLLRAQDALGGKIPDPPPQPVTTGGNDTTTEYIPTAVPAPNMTHLRYELPQRAPGPRSTGLGISSGRLQHQSTTPMMPEHQHTHNPQSNSAPGGIVWGGSGTMNAQGEVTWATPPPHPPPQADQQWQPIPHAQQPPPPPFYFHHPPLGYPQQPCQPAAFQGMSVDAAEFGPPPPSPGGGADMRTPASPIPTRGGWRGERPGPDPNGNANANASNTAAWNGVQAGPGPGPAAVDAPANGSGNWNGNWNAGQRQEPTGKW